MNQPYTPTIHIIDDEESLRTALSRLLSAAGYRVETYESANKFLEQSHAEGAGCIVLDVNMPGLSGVQLQNHLLAQQNELPIIFLTGHGDIAMSVRAIKAGAEDFIAKPVSREELLDAVERALRRYEESHSRNADIKELQGRVNTLTARELEVFNLLITGMLNKQIAFKLGNTERTVKAHRHSIMQKMQVKSVAELASIASRLGTLSRN
jgi:FixJ family two-component response regulator